MVSSVVYLVQLLAAALSDEPGVDYESARPDLVALTSAVALLAILVVGLASLMALGLDALVPLDGVGE